MRLATLLLTLSTLVALLVAPAGAAPGPETEMVRQGPTGFTLRVKIPEPQQAELELPDGKRYLRVTIPGFGSGGMGDPGTPDLPRRGFAFGLPEDAVAEVSARVIESETFAGLPPVPVPRRWIAPGNPFPSEAQAYEPDPAVYGAGALLPENLVELSRVMGWRHQRVQAVTVNAVQAAPGTGTYRVVRELEIEVTFRAAARSPGRASLVPAGPDAPGWDALSEGILVNSTSARSFRRRSAAAPVALKAIAEGDYFRVQIGTTGLCRIPYADLVAQGWPTGISVSEVRVEERGYDRVERDPYTVENIPRTVEDRNQNGEFDAGDFLVFYGFNYRDRFDPPFYHDRYSYFHCYWVTHGTEGGLEFPVSEGYPTGDDYTAITSFPHREYHEEDVYYINNAPQQGAGFYPIRSSFYWFDPYDVNALVRFDLADPDPEGEYRIKARWQGVFTTFTTAEHIVSLELNGCKILTDDYFTNRTTRDYDSGDLPIEGCVLSGPNTLGIYGRTPFSDRLSGAYFDWFEIIYDRLLIASGDAIRFNSAGERGKLEFTVTGFSSPAIDVYDVTDPLAPFRLEGQVTDAGGSYTLGLRVNVASGERDYYAVVRETLSGLPPSIHDLPGDLDPRPLAAGLSRDLIAEGAGSDYIMITHPNFREAWAPLVAHREAQGHRVFVADVWEIYDQFSGGDKTPWAIQRFLTQAFQTWTPSPSYLCLAGDASEDYRNDTDISDPDYVPTMMHYGNVGGTSGKELVGTDNWYVAFLREGDPDWDVMPEMHVARLPVSNVDEVGIITEKIIRFETEDLDADWRNRAVILADDQYSTSITAASSYQYNQSELTFRNTSQAVCDSIHALGRLPDFDCRLFFLDAYLDTVEALGRTGMPGNEPDLLTNSRYTRLNITPIIQDLLSEGELMWQFTGHANKNTICTESLFEHYPTLGIASRTLDGINNLNKPFVFFGYACHLNEFEHAREKADGQCIGEELLFAPNRGAVASLASTGYEWLPTNPDAQMYTSRAMFWDLPRDPDTGRPRRILGDCMTRALVANAFENNLWTNWTEMLRTYLTLGDPAMRIDISSVDLRVEIDGTPYDFDDPDPVTADTFTDSLSVNVLLSDDVDVSTIRVLEAGVELPEDRVDIVRPLPEDQGTQFYEAAFKFAIKLGTYDVAVEATEWTGAVTAAILPVRFETTWSSDGQPMDSGGDNRLDVDSPVTVEITSPVPLTADAFQLFVDETAIPGTVAAMDDVGRRWSVTANEIWEGGTREVTLRTEGGGAAVERSVSFMISEETLDLLTAYFYPNPYEEGPASLVYELTQTARSGELSVYSVSGRRVLRTEVPARAGRNAFKWDIRDAVGDEVANGVYLFVLKIEGYDGESFRHLERVAVTR